jgi:hypothetical protein
MASTFSYSSTICSATTRRPFTTERRSKHSAWPSQWKASTMRPVEAMRSSQVCRSGLSVGGEAAEGERLGDAAHQLGVAHLAEERARHGRAGGDLGGHEGRPPHLHRVDAPGLLAGRGAEHHQRAVFEEGVAVAGDGRRHLLADEVVRVEHVAPVALAEEDVEHVLPVGRADDPFELRGGAVGVEELVLAGDEVVARGEDDALVLGEREAGLLDGVDAEHLLAPRVVEEMAPGGLAVGLDAQEDERADAGVVDLRVVEGLVGVVDGLGVDALARWRCCSRP